MFATLATRCSDDVLANMFVAAEKVDSTKDIATKLEGFQLTNWEKGHKYVNDVFIALKLHKTQEKLFRTPTFSTWTTYTSRVHPDNPNGIMFATLTNVIRTF
ncbi:hypothetical protein JG687_00001114 [Phytophthora cactorum]|uniref:Uncharacterized protein n=1 Tax=Phytophthora cactorum TaxID=29920 RepID=A0A8T1V2Y5_9STRA|nr:hypothetical protein GQ600_16396 [Phytophthora cactorum]KAG6973086.1 hypothetical protein JG687_00001114 [Phytophthora cactorum]